MIGALLSFAGSNLVHDAKAVGGWIASRSFWQLVAMGLGAWMILVQFQLADARHDRDAYLKQRNEYRAQLDKLAAESKTQQKQTEKVIIRHETIVKPEAERRAKIIEDAPVIPGKCETPKEVLQADI